jgi:Cu(I)/Ag(I) efflux system membrane fusion protein
MNPTVNLRALALVLVSLLAIAGCERAPPPAAPVATGAAASAPAAPLYTCPMHHEVRSDHPGHCPICGMDLVPVAQAAPSAAADNGRRVLYYRHPHRADVTSPTPRKDEMGMDFVPVYGDEGGTVTVPAGVRQSLGIRTAPATRAPLARRVEAVATVAFDARGSREVRVRAEGWVERLHVRASGERVRAGEALFTLYAPKLATTREDLARARALGDADLVAAAEARLRALGAGPGGRGDRVEVVAPIDGVVAELGVLEGGLVTPEMVAARITPLGKVWVLAAVPESASSGLAPGAPALVTLAARPGERLEARVAEVLPELDAATRTVQARLVVANPGGQLLPGMVGTASIDVGAAREVVQVPLDALIRTGRGTRVVVALGDGRFVAREVVAGLESGDRVEVRAGLAPGEQVVVAGQFLLDSESSVRAGLARFGEPSPEAPAGARP